MCTKSTELCKNKILSALNNFPEFAIYTVLAISRLEKYV